MLTETNNDNDDNYIIPFTSLRIVKVSQWEKEKPKEPTLCGEEENAFHSQNLSGMEVRW